MQTQQKNAVSQTLQRLSLGLSSPSHHLIGYCGDTLNTRSGTILTQVSTVQTVSCGNMCYVFVFVPLNEARQRRRWVLCLCCVVLCCPLLSAAAEKVSETCPWIYFFPLLFFCFFFLQRRNTPEPRESETTKKGGQL